MEQGHVGERGEAQRKSAGGFFSRFRDSIVLIGVADPLSNDSVSTPYDPKPVPLVRVTKIWLNRFGPDATFIGFRVGLNTGLFSHFQLQILSWLLVCIHQG